MSYNSVALGIVGSPGTSPRGEQHVLETFYYTLVFPVPSAREMPRISYADVCEMLRGVTAGGPAREARAVDELRAAWEAKFRSGAPMAQDMIPFSALQELMRDVIIARFSALPGMIIRPRTESQDKGRILLSFRPTLALLRATAERLKMRMPASSALEIDSKAETKLWSQAEAQEEIYRLFLAGKITAEDAQIFDYEDSGMWSRRLRALQRFSAIKTGGQAEEGVVYLPFRDLAALRYVYRQIDDEGDGGGASDGSTLSPFRVVDKIRLTKALIDAEFDCDALLERGLLDHHLCPHTHRATDVDTSLDVLRVQWGALPSPWRLFCGLYQWFRSSEPTADPLLHVRNYFGEQLALYVVVALCGLRWAVWKLVCGGNVWRQVSTEAVMRPLRMVERTQGGNVRPTTTLLVAASTGSSIETDLSLVPYEGVLFDYAQLLVPLGFVAWFAPLAPLSCCVLAWIVAALQIRVDAHSLCYDAQRPFPIQTLSLGSWIGYLHVLRIGAILHSTVFMLMIFLNTTAADLDNKTFEQHVVALGALFAFVGWVSYALKDHQDLTEDRRLKLLRAKQAALESKYLGHLGTHLAASAKAALPPGRVFLNGVPRYVVTGDKGEEDAAEELRDQWRQQQMQMLGLEKRIVELRDSEDDTPSIGVLYVEVQGISLLPIASPIHSFVEFCVQSGTVGTGSGSSRGDSMSTKSLEASKAAKKETGGRIASPVPAQMANTSVSKKSRSPLWHESFELPVTALGDVLALRLCDGGPMIPSVRQRRVLGRAQLGIDDVITRTSSSTLPTAAVGLPAAASVAETKATKPKPKASSESSSSGNEDETGDINSSRSSVPRTHSVTSRPSSRSIDVPMATYELQLELPESLRRTKQSEVTKHGPPRLALRCGVRLNELGSLLVQQRRLREKLALLRSQEVQLSSWGGM
ncbi:50S ribosomal protein L13 [Phytophthora nicotianae]|uniref:50S ribosomal protein L13 n=1 Tax=Phytophthora nicotianae TaxID=4792 RepID=A0A0W8DL07_PHYNI|nr:50S ribosomal protein L13 [Phytophthora nicotianae]